jgi:acetamidase/formamidase
MRYPLIPGVAVGLLVLSTVGLNAQDTVRFEPTVGYRTFMVRDPVLRIAPGTVLVSRTNPGAYYTPAGGAFPGEVGPIYVEGATTDDMLKVTIHRVRPNYDFAAARLYTDFGSLSNEQGNRVLNPSIPERRYLWRLDRDAMTGTTELQGSQLDSITVDLQPMLGRLSVAPRGEESYSALWPGYFGGNMDARELREGTTVYLPVFHDGAYFYFGDGHARQGVGEIAGTGLETSMDVVLEIDVVKGRTIDWPRLEDADYIMVAGSARPLIDAFRIAHVELIEWLAEDWGFDRYDAYMLLGQLAESTIANVVDPQYTVVAKFPKRYLPR